MRYVINTDGGARGNPGPAGIGYVIALEDGTVLREGSEYIGEVTNNAAEYEAIVRALAELKKIIPKEDRKNADVEVRMDSELIVKQLNHQYQIKEDTLAPYFIKVHNMKVGTFPVVRFVHVPRSENSRADELVNEAIDGQRGK